MKIYESGGSLRNLFTVAIHNMDLGNNDTDYIVVGASENDMVQAGFKKGNGRNPVFHPLDNREDDYILAQRLLKVNGEYKFVHSHDVTLEEHLKRGDFTVNSLAREINSKDIIDVTGGIKDISEKTIRRIDDSVFKVSPSRTIRAIRIALQLGFKIDKGTRELMMQDGIGQISKNGLAKELKSAEKAGIAKNLIESIERFNLRRMLSPESLLMMDNVKTR